MQQVLGQPLPSKPVAACLGGDGQSVSCRSWCSSEQTSSCSCSQGMALGESQRATAAADLSGMILLLFECLIYETVFPIVIFIKLSDENENLQKDTNSLQESIC